MLKSWLTPRDVDEVVEVGPVMVAIGVLIVLATSGLDACRTGGFSWLPSEDRPDGNFIVGIVLPVFAIGTLWWARTRSPIETARYTLLLAVFTCLTTLLADLIHNSVSFMSFSMYCLAASTVAYLWPTRLAMTFASVSVLCILVQFIMVANPQRALSTWMACAVSLFGICIALSLSRDNSDRNHKKLERATLQDSLTGLASRLRIDQLMSQHETNPGSEDSVSLMICDVDNFKLINDRFGHPGGDEALRRIGALMSAVADRHDVPYRLGGDELAIYMPGKSLLQARSTAERVARTVNSSQVQMADGDCIDISITVGVAQTNDLTKVRTLYAAADSALTSGKQKTKGRVFVFGDTAAPGKTRGAVPTQPRPLKPPQLGGADGSQNTQK